MTIFKQDNPIRARALPIAIVFLTGLTLFQPTNWHSVYRDPNPVNRVTLTMALYHRGEVEISPEVALLPQQDVIHLNGRTYGSKAPGSSLWLLLFAPILDMLTPGMLNPMQLLVFGRLIALTLPWILFCYWFGVKLEAASDRVTAWGLILLMNFGSNAGAYATTYYGHALAAICLGMSLVWASDRTAPKPALAGLLSGFAVLTELNVAPLAAVNFLICVLRSREQRWSRAIAFVAGSVPGIAILAFYNTLTTGNPWTSIFKYDHIHLKAAQSSHIQKVIYGFAWPTRESLYGVFISPMRGWLFYSPWVIPVLILALYRLIQWMRSRFAVGTTAIHGLCAAAVLGFPLLMSGYVVWHGGQSLGIRFLVPLTPYLLILAAGYLRSDDRSDADPKSGIRPYLVSIFWGFGMVAATLGLLCLMFFPYNPEIVGLNCSYPLSFAGILLQQELRTPLWWDLWNEKGNWQLIPYLAPAVLGLTLWGILAVKTFSAPGISRGRYWSLRMVGALAAIAALGFIVMTNDARSGVRALEEKRPLLRAYQYRANFSKYLWSKSEIDMRANPETPMVNLK